jgi:hypothetical protein
MQNIDSQASLRAAIIHLERKQEDQRSLLEDHFRETLEGLKPVNLILNGMNEVVNSGILKDKIINSSVGLLGGYLSKVLYTRGSRNPVRRLVGNVIMIGVLNVVSKNPEIVRSFGKGLMHFLDSASPARHPSS